MERGIFVSPAVCYAPGMQSQKDWQLFAKGEKQIECSSQSPKLEFTTPLFRRRLSQLSKMTVQVVHDALEVFNCGDIPILFTSVYGEINREFTINRSLLQEECVMPAAFSLSVFNAPVALATLALSLKAGYQVVFPSRGDFSSSLMAAAAPVLSGKEKQILFVYADELFPEEYNSIKSAGQKEVAIPNVPLAFALVLRAEPPADGADSCAKESVPYTFYGASAFTSKKTPVDFLKMILASSALQNKTELNT